MFIEPVKSQIINSKPLSERLTGYSFDVRLDTLERTVTGTMSAWWVNNSDDYVPDIHLHLYMNAFSSNRTTFYIEKKGSPGNDEDDYGWINMETLSDRNGLDLLLL